MTNAERWQRDMKKGRWRTAATEHRCDAFFYRHCVGAGVIPKGARYFDTGESTHEPFHTARVCLACANREDIAAQFQEVES